MYSANSEMNAEALNPPHKSDMDATHNQASVSNAVFKVRIAIGIGHETYINKTISACYSDANLLLRHCKKRLLLKK